MVSSRSRRPASSSRSRKKSSAVAGGQRPARTAQAATRWSGSRKPVAGSPARVASWSSIRVAAAPGQRALGGDDRQRVEQLEGEGLRRVDERLLRRPALPGDLVERGGDRVGVGHALRRAARARWPAAAAASAATTGSCAGTRDLGSATYGARALEQAACSGASSAPMPDAGPPRGGPPRRPAPRRSGRRRCAWPRTAMSLGPVQTGSVGTGDDVDRDRAGRPEQGAQHRGRDRALAAGDDDQPAGAAAVGDPAEPGLGGQPGGLPDLGTGAGDGGQQAPRVAGAQELEVVEDLLGELGRSWRPVASRQRPVPGLVEQQHGDAVAHREGAVAGGAEQLARPPRPPSAGCGGCRGRRGSTAAGGRAPAVPCPCRSRVGHARTIPRTWSRSSAIRAASGASTLSRSSGSVLLARRLNHDPSGSSTVSPSMSSTVTPSCVGEGLPHLRPCSPRHRRRWS